MTLKDMRKQAGYTQAQLADICGINRRTLQDYEQGHKPIESAKGETLYRLSQVLGYSINDILKDSCEAIEIRINENSNREMEKRLQMYQNAIMKRKMEVVHFPIIASDDYVDMSRIYPTKQRDVKKVIDELRGDIRLNSLRLFGSSISMACNRDSDIDFAVGINDLTNEARNDISEKIQLACDWNADIIWMDHITPKDRIYGDIMKGVVLI